MNNHIPDPIELSNSMIERQIDLVDENNTYPCCYCGKRFDIDTMVSISPNPDSPLCCEYCIEVTFTCKEDFMMHAGWTAFTKDEEYKGHKSWFCWILKNDNNEDHHLPQRHIDEYFKVKENNEIRTR